MLINTIRLDCEANRSESVKTCIASFINNCPKATFFIFSCFLKGYKAGQKEISPKTLDQLCMENNQLCMEKNGGCLTAEEGINLIQNETERIASIPYFVEADVVIPIIKNLNIENPNVRDMMYNIIKSYLKYTFNQPTEFTVKYNKAKEMLAILNEGFKEKPVLQNLVKGVINDCNAILVGEYAKHVLFLKQPNIPEIEGDFEKYKAEDVYNMGLRCFTGECLANNLDFGGLSEFFPLLLDIPYFEHKTINEILHDEYLKNILAFWKPKSQPLEKPKSQPLEKLKYGEFELWVLSDQHYALAISSKDRVYILDSLGLLKEGRFSFEKFLKKQLGNQTVFQNSRNYMSCAISTMLSLKAVLNIAFQCKEKEMDFATQLENMSKSFCELTKYLGREPNESFNQYFEENKEELFQRFLEENPQVKAHLNHSFEQFMKENPQVFFSGVDLNCLFQQFVEYNKKQLLQQFVKEKKKELFIEYLQNCKEPNSQLLEVLIYYVENLGDEKYDGLFFGFYMLMTQELEKLLHNADKTASTMISKLTPKDSELDTAAASSAATPVSPSSASIPSKPEGSSTETGPIFEKFKNLFQNPNTDRIAIDDMQKFIEGFKKLDSEVFEKCPEAKEIAKFMLKYKLLQETDLKPEILEWKEMEEPTHTTDTRKTASSGKQR